MEGVDILFSRRQGSTLDIVSGPRMYLLLWNTAVLGVAVVVAHWVWANILVVLHRLWATRDIPEPSGSLLLGHVPALVQSRSRTFRVFYQWSLQWPIYRMRLLLKSVVVITDPDLYQPLLRPGPSKLPKDPAIYRMFQVFTNPERSNLLTSPENSTWQTVRRAAVAALTMNNLRLCFPHITAVTQRLIHSLAAAGPGAVFDMDAVASAITVDVICLAAFNRDLQATVSIPAHHDANSRSSSSSSSSSTAAPTKGQPPGQHVQCQHKQPRQQAAASGVQSGDAAAGGAKSAAPSGSADASCDGEGRCGAAGKGICGSVAFPRGPEALEVIGQLLVAMQARTNPLNRWLPWRKARRDLFYWGGRMNGLVQDLTTSMEVLPPPPTSLGAHLLAARDTTGQPLDRHQIMAEIGIIWAAGFETTAHSLCWALFLLSTHPEAEARLCAELDSLGLLAGPHRPTPDALQWEHLSKLHYLSAVIKESMRMYPVASSGTVRITTRPMQLGQYHLPAGTQLLIPFWSIHRSPRLWPDPHAFKPERFLAADPAAQAPTQPAAAPAHSTGGVGMSPGELQLPVGQVSKAAAAKQTAVDVAADLQAVRDQQQQRQEVQQEEVQQGKHKLPEGYAGRTQQRDDTADATSTARRSSDANPAAAAPAASCPGTRARPAALELKDPTVDRTGFLPFSIGSRNCVGQALALVELKAVLALLLGTYSFTLHPDIGGFEGVDASAKQTVTLRPEHGLLMTLTPRAGAGQLPGG